MRRAKNADKEFRSPCPSGQGDLIDGMSFINMVSILG